jgi:hypothetical protein
MMREICLGVWTFPAIYAMIFMAWAPPFLAGSFAASNIPVFWASCSFFFAFPCPFADFFALGRGQFEL